MSESWIIRAIEREAMTRAHRELQRTPMTFTWMGVSADRMTWLIMDYERRTGQRADRLDPSRVEVE